MNRAILTVIMLLLLPLATFADNGRVSVREAIDLALERNHLLKAADYERQSAAHEVSASRSRYFPRVFLEESAAASNAPTRVFMMKLDEGRFSQNDFAPSSLNHPDAYHDFRTALSLEMPLLDFTIGKGAGMAGKEEEARSLTLESRRQEIASKVYAAFLEIRRAKAYLAAAQQALVDAQEHQRLAVVRSEAGVGLRSDELRARTFLAEIEQQNITANNELVLAKLRLSLVTGGDAGEPLDITDEVDALDVTLDMAELKRLARLERPDLKAMEKGAEKAALGVAMARSAYLPTIYASASYQLNDNTTPFGRDNDSWSVGATLRWELFDGMRRRNEVGKTVALEKAAAEYVTDYRQEVDFQVVEGFLRSQEVAKRLEVARHAVVDADESVRLLEKRFQNSLATMVELLDAQMALNKARANLVEMENQRARAAVTIYRAAGIFLQEVKK